MGDYQNELQTKWRAQYEQQIEGLQRSNNRTQSQIEKLTSDNRNLISEQQDLRAKLSVKDKEIEILKRSQSYLQDQNRRLMEKIETLQSEITSLDSQLLKQKHNAQDLIDKFLNLKHQNQRNLDELLQSSLEELKEEHNKELEYTKAHLQEFYQSQINYYKEQKNAAEKLQKENSQEIKERTNSYNNLLLEYNEFKIEAERQIGSLKSELAVKQEAANWYETNYKQTQQELQQLKIDTELQKDKLDIVRQEFYRTDTELSRQLDLCKQEIKNLTKELQEYQELEKDLEQALSNLHLPISPSNILQQVLWIATELKEKQLQCDKLRDDNLVMSSRLQQLSEIADDGQRLFQDSQQPFRHLVLTIRDKDKEIAKLNTKLKRLIKKNLNIGQNNIIIKQKQSEAENDLKKLLKNRQDYANIQETLSQISQKTISTQKRSKNSSPKTTIPNWYTSLKQASP